MTTEQLPFSEAIDYLANKLNLDTDSWVEGQGLVQQVAFTSAGAKGQILQDIRTAVDLAINNGISIADFAKRFDIIADTYVDNWQLKGDRAWRAQLIFDQNLRQAYGHGRYTQLTEPSVLKSRPFWIFKHGDSRVPRPTHLAMDGKVFPAGSLKCHVPAGFNCRCQIFSLSKRDIDREGLKVEDVDFEADKGFNYLPGKLTKERRDELLKNLDPDIRKLVEGDTEAEFARIPEGTTRRRGGVNQVLQNSRWHNAESDTGDSDIRKAPKYVRNEAIQDLTDEFEAALDKIEEDIQTVPTLEEVRKLRDSYRSDITAAGDKLIRSLMQLNSRDEAEAWAAKIDVSGISSQKERASTVRNAADFYQLIGKDLAIEVVHSQNYNGRACANPIDNSISLPEGRSRKSNRSTQFHEMAHFTEFRDPESGKLAKEWIQGRAEGEAKSIAELTGNSGYRASETALPDKFIHPYIGKLYDGSITEVHSMGLECFADGHSVVNLFKKDREHFDLMIRYIRQ